MKASINRLQLHRENYLRVPEKKAELYRQALMASDRNQSLLEKEAYGKQIKFNKKLSDFISIVKP